jgi:hypothetical protein
MYGEWQPVVMRRRLQSANARMERIRLKSIRAEGFRDEWEIR